MITYRCAEDDELRAHWKARCIDLLAKGHPPHAVFESLWVSGLAGWLAIYGPSSTAAAIDVLAALLPSAAEHSDIELLSAIADGKTVLPTPSSDITLLGSSWRSDGIDLSLAGCQPHDIAESMLMTALSGYLTINGKDSIARAFAIVAAGLRVADQAETSERAH